MAGVPDLTASLALAVGFVKTSQRLGRVATSKTIREAVVAVPFVENNSGVRLFYSIDKDTIGSILSPVPISPKSGAPGQSIIDMVDAMQRYNFPPSMDFVKYPDVVDPFSMYIFEFEHKLNQQDLINIWQNLPPRIARAFDPDEAQRAGARIDSEELIQTKTVSHTLEDGQLLNRIDDKLQWMVFKVKQRAQTNYYDKVVQNNSSLNIPSSIANSVSGLMQIAPNIQDYTAGGAGAGGVDKRGEPYMRSYNWPYDFFSLVELVKIDDEVTYTKDFIAQTDAAEDGGFFDSLGYNSPQPQSLARQNLATIEAQTQVGQNTIGTVFEARTAVAPSGARSYGAVTTKIVKTLK